VAARSVGVAEEAGTLLTALVPEIERTAELIRGITGAATDQAGMVAQVNESTTQLEQVTQQNASSSEELAATAEQLNGQAQGLLEAVGYFRTGA
jgi:methyl-accepting chemotaxis protein